MYANSHHLHVFDAVNYNFMRIIFFSPMPHMSLVSAIFFDLSFDELKSPCLILYNIKRERHRRLG